MKAGLFAIIALFAFIILLVMSGALYTVDETKQVIITEFGDIVGEPITDAGLHFKKPFIQVANQIENRVLEWDGHPNAMPTKDKTFIVVDTFGRWQIEDARKYFEKLRDERSARSRLDDILGSETRNSIAKHELIEVIRTDKDRVPARDDSLDEVTGSTLSRLYSIRRGRSAIENDIFEAAASKLSAFGIKLLDVRFKRINYNETVRERIYDRMKSERQQIAERFRSEGQGEAAKIIGNKGRDLKDIESTAYKKIQEIQGKADAEATAIYAGAYNQSPTAAEFYAFLKTMETYDEVMDNKTTVLLSTDSDLFQYLNKVTPTKPEAGARVRTAPPSAAVPQFRNPEALP